MFKDFISKKGNYLVVLENIIGTGWIDDIETVIRSEIKPNEINRITIKESWDYSEYEIWIKKDKIEFVIELDDDTPCSLKLISENKNLSKQKLREWGIIIAERVNM